MAMYFARLFGSLSLKGRLLTVCVVGMIASAGIVTVAASLLLSAFSQYMLRSGIRDSAAALAKQVTFDASGRPLGIDETRVGTWVFSALESEVVLLILDKQGEVIYANRPGTRPLAPEGASFEPSRDVFQLTRNGVSMHAATVPIDRETAKGYIQFAASDRLVLLMRRSIGFPALIAGLVATFVIFFVIFALTTNATLNLALAPLRAASAAARAITPRTLEGRLEVKGLPREISPVVEGFNQALDRLEVGFRRQQDFLSNAAHELKTPLALIRAEVELGPANERRAHLLQDVDQMARQVQQLLLLAEVSEPRSFRIESRDPKPAVQEAFDYMARVAERHGVVMAIRVADNVKQWNTDLGALFTLLKNLLENAIQHSPKGGVVALDVTATGFTVTDQGCGVPPEELPYIFDRFWRGRERRHAGAGLGLAICQEIAAAHGWQLSAMAANPGLRLTAAIG